MGILDEVLVSEEFSWGIRVWHSRIFQWIDGWASNYWGTEEQKAEYLGDW
ncbi:MAG: hypothetical protein Ct9H90mP23_1450 [Methanobacteriota archaeon]|nr:MAG: hypothetical protein Ct9H90mP23_1450 [Euryarchaeota archaeon]